MLFVCCVRYLLCLTVLADLAQPRPQIMVPPEGARYLVASDGLWDRVSQAKVHRAVRSKSLDKLPAYLMSMVNRSSGGVLRDDATAIAVDILPSRCADFKRMITHRRRSRSRYPRLARLCAGPVEIDDLSSLLADEDGLLARGFGRLVRKNTISFDLDSAPEAFKREGDFTVHGGKENARGRAPKPPTRVNTMSSALPLWLVCEARAGSM
ncbi:unnamed protein product [Ostreobium quekettii]|uniref:Protein-serine/threonine phosphatase n=1 Tax=Ostreobium quekettii TaxID=121088 RepID=A0A8S1IME5_9CHLO|nr:unnamed protein product [Ostreobium quekettii]|eukprot:evm.model.scf_1945.4 EVM.evm.TU.scf_1945.4   scf_1945:28343-28972(-)